MMEGSGVPSDIDELWNEMDDENWDPHEATRNDVERGLG